MRFRIVVSLCFAMAGSSFGQSPEIQNAVQAKLALAKLKAVGKEGNGNVAASQAWKELVTLGPGVLPEVLAGLDDATPLAGNWIRSAYETILQRAEKAGTKIDPTPLIAFLQDTKHAGQARRLAFETLAKLDPSLKARLLPDMLDDPGNELRREAVEVLLKNAQKLFDAKDQAAALKTYQKALQHAREKDQVTIVGDRLKKLGVDVDLTKQFGFVTEWALIGPFENTKGIGFGATYPPNKAVNLKESIVGKGDAKVEWKNHVTDLAMGLVDLNKAVGPLKGAVVFGYSEVTSPVERPIEVRCGSNNAVRMYLNGQEIYFRDEYHHGMVMDQHVGKGLLKAGRNTILIKVCQNEQTDSWAQQWSFQLRLCDHLGGAVPFSVALGKVAN